MKKCLGLLIMCIFLITGCGQMTLEKAIDDFAKNVEYSKSYKLNGTMEITSGDELFTYNIDTYYLKDNYYKVVLVNQTNNHEQVILKNKDGLYVITPSLNKSYKFDSVWPENSSQAYILQNLLNDIKGDNSAELEIIDNGYIIKSKVNYPNNEELIYQKVYFDKDMNLKKVEVYNTNDTVQIKVTFKTINYKARLNDDDFLLDSLIKENKECSGEDCDKPTSFNIENIAYPLYIPDNTHLSNNENVSTEYGDRVILTFGGDKNFVLVEEPVSYSEDFEIIPVFGDPLMLDEAIGAMSSNSISWNSNNISYYLVSSDLATNELIKVAKSLNGTRSVMSNK